MPDKSDQETVRIVLQLDDAISAFRAGEATGLRALDSASRMMGDLADDAIARASGQRGVSGRPDRVELAILTALVDTYGAELLNPDFVRLAEAYGAVGLRARDPTQVGRLVADAVQMDRPVLIEVPVSRMPRPMFSAPRRKRVTRP